MQPEPFDPALDEAVLADLEGTTAYRRYEDWLRQRGDPRAALIATQLSSGPAGADAEDVLQRHRARFLGDGIQPRELGGRRRPAPLTWHAGFLKSACLTAETAAEADDIPRFLALRSCRFLRELEINVWKGTCDLTLAPSLPIRKLEVYGGDGSSSRADLTAETVASIGRAGFDRLEDLSVSIGYADDVRLVDALEPVLQGGCPSLEHLYVFVQRWTPARHLVERIAASPALARLETLRLIRAAGVQAIVGRAEAFAHLKSFHVQCDDEDRFRLAYALPGVAGLTEGLPESTLRVATNPPPVQDAVTGNVPIRGCASCGGEDVAVLEDAQTEAHPMANSDLSTRTWTVHCRPCNKLTTWTGRY